MSLLTQVDIKLQSNEEVLALFGPRDTHLKIIEKEFGVEIITRGSIINVRGGKKGIAQAENVLHYLLVLIRKKVRIETIEVYNAVKSEVDSTLSLCGEMIGEELIKNAKLRPILAKTLGQVRYVTAIRENDLVFGIGPAGTGKTYLAVVMAVLAFRQQQVKKIILTRPAVEAGEKLGFLPGDLKEKVDPYLRPLYNALYDLLGMGYTEKLIERGVIEIAPLAYMRGRTLDEAFVILDEAQNTTPAQMKMFLTRLGFNSKMIITGDKTQLDLPKGAESGLLIAEEVLYSIPEISFTYFSETDVVRHPLVSKIIKAYANY